MRVEITAEDVIGGGNIILTIEQMPLALEGATYYIKPKTNTGQDLVNMFFEPCCEDYFSAEIVLFSQIDSNWRLMARYPIEEAQFFKSVNGLAPGTYAYVLQQNATDKTILFKTDYITFEINRRQVSSERRITVVT